MRELSALQLHAHLESCETQPLLLDVRQPWEMREIVVICHHGIRSRSVGRYLEHAGFSNIINLSGDVDQWAKTVDKQMATY